MVGTSTRFEAEASADYPWMGIWQESSEGGMVRSRHPSNIFKDRSKTQSEGAVFYRRAFGEGNTAALQSFALGVPKSIANWKRNQGFGPKTRMMIIEGPLGRAHRRPSIYAWQTIADWRKEACDPESATAGGRHRGGMY